MPRASIWSPPAAPFTLANVAPLGVTSNTLRWAERRGLITRLARGVAGPQRTVAVRALPAHHRTEHPSGLRLTTPARTAVDVAATSSLPDALVVLDSFARLRLVELVGQRGLRRAYTSEGTLARARQPLLEASRHAATQFTRRHLAEVVPMADPRRESPAESESFGHFVLAGLPLPQMQVRLITPMGEAYPDFRWDRARLVGEVDGAVKYQAPEDLVAEKRRQEAIEQTGDTVVRWMAEEIHHRPASVVQRVLVRLDAAGLV